ncbi:integrase core domain protein [Ancylostoma duodenale]|uniref:Integrase core domain protein n=1 Tax=Ancylostoma duodenale TaxID=51022 RepID=A0A0C2F106_9BILA|nr:integrase core domain protein [Ancylostoma duodenale]
MPSLPPERVNRSRPFQNVGLDYLGPVYYRDQLHSQAKIWICLFTCMATSAVHLELVHNNTAFEFLLALRRFIARRGTPDLIISDNATTFTSGNDALQKVIYNKDTIKRLSSQFANRRITWKFNTPLSPWKGGFYERLVGLFKSAFKKAIQLTLLSLSQLHTLVAEIEAVLNSRPLLSVSDTSSSSLVLRPKDFISPQVEL